MEQENQITAPSVSSIPPPPPLPGMAVQKRRRPICVVIIGILFLIGAIFEIWPSSSHETGFYKIADDMSTVVFFLLELITGVGLVLWKPKIRVIAIYVLIFRFLADIPMSTHDAYASPTTLPFGTIGLWLVIMYLLMGSYFAMMIFFLTRPGVKAAFAES